MASTGGGFTPSAVQCPAPMTMAAAIVLRNAGGLDAQCHYLITDWVQAPNLAGPNLVELHAVNATSFAQDVNVFTPYDNTAWVGQFDLDAGQMLQLQDNLGNTVRDAETGTNIMGLFPWGNGFWSENTFDSVTLTTSPASLARDVRRNTVRNAVLNLAAWTAAAGTIVDSTIDVATITSSDQGMTIVRSRVLEGAIINLLGAGTFSLTNSTVEDSFTLIASNVGSLGAITIAGSSISSGVNVRCGPLNTTVNGIVITNSRLSVRQPSPGTPDVHNNGTGLITIVGSTVAQSIINNLGGANITLTQADVIGSNINRLATSLSIPLTIGGAELKTTTVSMQDNPTGAIGALSITRGTYHQATITDRGSNAAVLTSVYAANSQITIGLGVVRGLAVQACSMLSGNLNQNSLGAQPASPPTSVDFLLNSQIIGAGTGVGPGGIVNFNINDNAAPGCTVRSAVISESTLNVGNVNGSAAIVNLHDVQLNGACVLNWTGPGRIFNSRLLASVMSNAGFEVQGTIIEGGFTKVLTAANTNRLANAAFDNIL